MAGDIIEFRVLGPIEAGRNGVAIRLNGRKTRSVLAALLMRAGEVVPTSRLVAIVWGEDPPATAMTQVHKCVSQIRGLMGREFIQRWGNGYRLLLGENQLDLLEFDRLISSARSALAKKNPAEATGFFSAALALWRGEPLADGTEELIRAEGPALDERKIAAHLESTETELSLGRHAEVIGELKTLVAAHPLREQLRGRLMLALYRSGRVAEALAEYRAARTVLAQELGLDPGVELGQLHAAILACDPALDADATETPPPRGTPALAQLPPAIGDFTGRVGELECIRAVLTAGPGDAPRVVAISGKGGVGKTALAVQAAQRLADVFPDGHLYARLRGPEARPLDPLVVLKRFLRALGVEDSVIPDSLDECGQLFRSRCATRRMLIVLDDAGDESQVRPLLPGYPTCAVLVTSRPRLSGLEAAHHIDLGVFDSDESVELLEHIVGRSRLGDDRTTVLEIVRLCGRLPLAVRVAAARLAQHRRGDLSWFARRLTDERRRLDVLVAGDLEVRASLALSYLALKERERAAFCLLSLLDAPDFAAWTVAPLLGVSVYEAEDLVEELVNAQLLDIVGSYGAGRIRYRFHDLVRLYARERAEAELSDVERRAGVNRVLGAWLTLATEADERLHGTRFRGWSPLSAVGTASYDGFSPAEVDDLLLRPLEWFEAEGPALTAAISEACSRGPVTVAWALAESTANFLELRHLYDEWADCHTHVLDACEAEGIRFGAAITRLRLARLRLIRKDIADALALAENAAESLRELGGTALYAEALAVRAATLRCLGEHDRALGEAGRAVDVARVSGNRPAEAQAVRELGTIRYEQAEWVSASAHFSEAVRLSRELGNRREEAMALRSWAVVLRHRGLFADARERAETALAAFRELGDRPYEAFSRLTLGLVLTRLGDPTARGFLDEGITMLREMDLMYGVGETLYTRGVLELAEGDAERAADTLVEAIGILSADPVHHVLLSAVEVLAHALRVGGHFEAADAVGSVEKDLSPRLGRSIPSDFRAFIASFTDRQPTGRNTEALASRLPA